ncbi:hypothetical protein GQ43DRAFT_441142 [Delitschia confertaspora ATCC 74209]|uniref:Secreted protein n=1 Tax=Delitschia confertaspora ATCC 74209 TaxID=1513339 RepID=A0A9P4JQP7_9PLEO|nr:hypothetical protein GQ43DRAFT_441142 [Delitschia confertaspora ATCC 74209]
MYLPTLFTFFVTPIIALSGFVTAQNMGGAFALEAAGTATTFLTLPSRELSPPCSTNDPVKVSQVITTYACSRILWSDNTPQLIFVLHILSRLCNRTVYGQRNCMLLQEFWGRASV